MRLVIPVLNQAETVDGVTTRVVEERELEDGELVEISRNFFAICNRDNSVFYFGEDVDFYENGVIVSHDGAGRAGVNGARAGILMPGTLLLGARHFQGVAHSSQNFAPGRFSAPHVGQRSGNGVAHSLQNFAPTRFSLPHVEHCMRCSSLTGQCTHQVSAAKSFDK